MKKLAGKFKPRNLSGQNDSIMATENDNQTPKDHLTENDIPSASLNMFVRGNKRDMKEVYAFDDYITGLQDAGVYAFEAIHLQGQNSEGTIQRATGEKFDLINLSNYNYLGYGHDPRVIQAAKDALDTFGLGAASTPIISGTLSVHKQLEDALVKFFDVPDTAISLFSSGYGVNTGTISAIMKPNSHIILDRCAHMSIIEGANLSRANLHWFEHNNMEQLEAILKEIEHDGKRIMICCEGVYSADGDRGDIKGIVKLAKQYNAMTLVDEAHSVLIGGEHGRGIAEEQGVLHDIDFYVMTFSKSFCGIGGAVLAKKEYITYINWYARCRMFSCAMDPAVTGGILKSLELAAGEDGHERRRKLVDNAHYLREQLEGKVNMLDTDSWIIPVIYSNDKLTPIINDYLQQHGLDAGLMTFPAVPRGQSRIRLFITSDHTKEQLDRTANILVNAAKEFDFHL